VVKLNNKTRQTFSGADKLCKVNKVLIRLALLNIKIGDKIKTIAKSRVKQKVSEASTNINRS